MSETIEQQFLLHEAATYCDLGLLRAATPEGADPMPIIGLELGRDQLIVSLTPALELAWPDRPAEVSDEELESFLGQARVRIVATLQALSGDEGFVPAAHWNEQRRALLLEHLRDEVDALIGGARVEGLWFAFAETHDTAPLAELIQTGMLIKLRVVGDFLVLKPSRFNDELTAAEFFTAGAWQDFRDDDLAAELQRRQRLVHKQIAHLTLTRPLPEKKYVYRPSSYRSLVEDLITLLDQFTAAVDPRLVPEWWHEWNAGLADKLREF